MPRNGSNIYSKPAGTTAVTGTTIESVKYNNTIDDLVADANNPRPIVAGGTGGTSESTARNGLKIDATIIDKSSAYTVLVTDRSKLVRSTAALTLSFPAAATLGNGWYIDVLASVGTLTIDPNASETIDGSTTLDIPEGKSARIRCDGTSFYSQFKTVSAGISEVADDTTPQYGGTMDTNSHQHRQSKGADAPSATALTVGVDGNYFDVTGTNTITSINTLAVGTEITLHFDASLTLTHNATNLILPGGANYTTAAGDEFTFVEYSVGQWRCVGYALASGKSLVESSNSPIKAWVTFDGTGVVSIKDSFNVSSITDNGTGDYTINFTNALANSNYAVSTGNAAQFSNRITAVKGSATGAPTDKTTTTLTIITQVSGSPVDIEDIYVLVVGS